MTATKILDMENDGLNMAADGRFLYIRCKRTFLKYDFTQKQIAVQNTVFKKDGKSRSFAVCGKYLIVTDFCDLLVLDKSDLQVVKTMRLGADLSSDLGVVRSDERSAYINIRNGKMAVLDLQTLAVSKYEICEESSWEHCVAGNRLYTGTVNGSMVETDKTDMRLLRKVKPCKKNIYSVVFDNGVLYTVSQDGTIKALDARTLAVIRTANHAVKGMTRIIGLYRGFLLIADGRISIWDKNSLTLQDRLDIPTGHFNKGAILQDKLIIGSDSHSIYTYAL